MSTYTLYMPYGKYPGEYLPDHWAVDYNAALGELLDYGEYTRSTSTKAVYEMDNGVDLVILGSRLTYSKDNGVLNGGTITSLSLVGADGGATMQTVTGLHWSGGSFYNTVRAGDSWYTAAVILSGNDKLVGSKGDDELWAFAGKDNLVGGAGNDALNGGAGADTLSGGAGHDVASYAYASKSVIASLAKPSINTNDAKGDSYSSIENLAGSYYADKLYGNSGANELNGRSGVDALYGGAGTDKFVFRTDESGATRAKADTIYDFTNVDSIDLTGWDANEKRKGIQDFDFIGSQGFHGKAGEMHFIKGASDTWIEGDTDGDRKADFIIHLDDAVTMKGSYFEL